MKKLVFFDIDGTLIDIHSGRYNITDSTKQAMDELKANGHDVFLATGRTKCFILDSVMEYDFSGYVTCNGGYVEYKNDEVFSAKICEEAIRETRKISEEYNFVYFLEGVNNIYVPNVNDERIVEFCDVWGMKKETLVDEFSDGDIETYIGMIVVSNQNEIAIMEERLSPYFHIQRHQNDYSFDLTLKNTSKARGIEELVSKLGYKMEDTIAFGDANNDIEMLETVNLGIAMGNAMDAAKDVADYITDHANHDGIVNALKHFKLIG